MNVVDKILALKRLSENQSATPAEAASAAARVQELMLKHKISEADVGTREETVQWFPDALYEAKRESKWRSTLASGLARINGCRVMKGLGPNGTRRLSLIGYEGDVEVVRYLFKYLERETERLARKYLRTEGPLPGRGRHAGESYRMGCALKLIQILDAQKAATVAEAEQAGLTGALTVIDQRDAALQQWMDAKGCKRVPVERVDVDAPAFHAGAKAADTIPLRTAIESQAS